MSFFITLLISILSHQDDSSIRGMALSEVYLKADEMKSFAFESKDYIDTVRSVAFDFISLDDSHAILEDQPDLIPILTDVLGLDQLKEFIKHSILIHWDNSIHLLPNI